jgi:hypothetical protein
MGAIILQGTHLVAPRSRSFGSLATSVDELEFEVAPGVLEFALLGDLLFLRTMAAAAATTTARTTATLAEVFIIV